MRAQIEAGTCEAPVTFEYDDVVADLNRDATRVEDVHWIERPVHLRFTDESQKSPELVRPRECAALQCVLKSGAFLFGSANTGLDQLVARDDYSPVLSARKRDVKSNS